MVGNVGLKAINENTVLSKLMINDVMRDSVYVCVAINYHGISFREFFINVYESENSNNNEYYGSSKQQKYEYEFLFLIPILIVITLLTILFTILYLLIRRKISEKISQVDNKIFI